MHWIGETFEGLTIYTLLVSSELHHMYASWLANLCYKKHLCVRVSNVVDKPSNVTYVFALL